MEGISGTGEMAIMADPESRTARFELPAAVEEDPDDLDLRRGGSS